MSSPGPDAQRTLLATALAALAERLRRAAQPGSAGDPAPAVDQAQGSARAEIGARSPIDELGDAFELSPFERDILLLCAGAEMSPDIAARCAALSGDPRATKPTFGLAMTVLSDPHWSAITSAGPLRRWRLIEVEPGPTLTSSPLGISERVLHHILGAGHLDERLQGVVEPVDAPSRLSSSQRAAAARIVEIWRGPGSAAGFPVLHLASDDDTAHRAVATCAAAALGVELHALRALDLPASPADRDSLLCLWEREIRLRPSVLLVECEGLEDTSAWHLVSSFVDRAKAPLLVATRRPVRLKRRTVIRLDVESAGIREQEAAWREVLGPAGEALNGQVESIAAAFNLGAHGIHGAAVEALGASDLGAEEPLGERLWEICRARARPRLGELARRIVASADWADLVLPEAQRVALRDVTAHLRQRYRVYETWGFGAKTSRGLGTSVLFSGASGTGKTMAAEVLARSLGLDLYCIDLSQVISKYIGETEKNLRRVFDAADEGGAVLLFDEADALFGKRSDVKDSHDRYANIEVSYLLQRLEAYRGLAILTTNMKTALDAAFLRRFRFVISFPFPDPALRAEMWRRAFPRGAPTEGLDVFKLARLNVTGGNIRNIALNAAFLAADGGEPVRMSHLLRAARAECAKLEKPVTEAELGGWS